MVQKYFNLCSSVLQHHKYLERIHVILTKIDQAEKNLRECVHVLRFLRDVESFIQAGLPELASKILQV